MKRDVTPILVSQRGSYFFGKLGHAKDGSVWIAIGVKSHLDCREILFFKTFLLEGSRRRSTRPTSRRTDETCQSRGDAVQEDRKTPQSRGRSMQSPLGESGALCLGSVEVGGLDPPT